jgi:cell division protein FtsB
MALLLKAKEPFRFYTRLHLSELTGLRATTLTQLVELIKDVPGSSIYHHTHRFLQQHQVFSPEPPNDFAYWVTEILGEKELGERLASIDIMQFSKIHDLRAKIVSIIEEYLKEERFAKLKFAREGEEFYFIKSVSFVIPTDYVVDNLVDFVEVLKKITFDAIYFHIFEARLRLEKKTNDFSNWIEHSVGDKELADELAELDPYTRTLDDLRAAMIRIISKRLFKP